VRIPGAFQCRVYTLLCAVLLPDEKYRSIWWFWHSCPYWVPSICLSSCLGGAGRSSTSVKLPSASPLPSAGNGRGNWAAAFHVVGKGLDLLDLLQTPKAPPAPNMNSVMLKDLISLMWALSEDQCFWHEYFLVVPILLCPARHCAGQRSRFSTLKSSAFQDFLFWYVDAITAQNDTTCLIWLGRPCWTGCQELVLHRILSQCPVAVSPSESPSVLKAVGASCVGFPVGYHRIFSQRNLNLRKNWLLFSQFFSRNFCWTSSVAVASHLPVLHFCPSCWTGAFPVACKTSGMGQMNSGQCDCALPSPGKSGVMVFRCACISGVRKKKVNCLFWLDSSWAAKTWDVASFIFKHLAKLPSRKSCGRMLL